MQYIVFNKYDNVIYCNVLGTKCSIFSLREWNKEGKKKKDTRISRKTFRYVASSGQYNEKVYRHIREFSCSSFPFLCCSICNLFDMNSTLLSLNTTTRTSQTHKAAFPVDGASKQAV